jgi:(p)ppGpp synthase/HD superfamily hydrolase
MALLISSKTSSTDAHCSMAIPMHDLELVSWAQRVATGAHCATGKMRRDALYMLPYIVHPLRVSRLVAHCGGSSEAVAAALLHDVLEDTTVSGKDWPTSVKELVVAVTHLPGENKLASVERLRAAPREATLVKLADRYDNSTAETNGQAYFERPDVMESTVRLIEIAEHHGYADCLLTVALRDMLLPVEQRAAKLGAH